MFSTTTLHTPGVSTRLEIYNDGNLVTHYEYTASTDTIVLSERAEVTTDYAGIAPTIDAINAWRTLVERGFVHTKTVSNFRQLIRRTGSLLEIELGQGGDLWAAAIMERDTDAIVYAARAETVLAWTRFNRWVDVQVEFMRLAREG